MANPSKLLKTCLFAALILFCSFLAVSAVEGVATSEEATAAMAQAEETLTVAYRGLLEAEKASANVSGLLVKLNGATNFLDDANVFYGRGDFDGAVQNSTASSQLSEQVRLEAPYLKELAVSNASWRFGWTVFVSVVGAVGIVAGGFFGWRVFRRRYLRKMLEMKPEVSESES